MKQKYWLLLLLIPFSFLVWKIFFYKEPTFNKITFNSSCKIHNYTSMQFVDTILQAGLRVVGIDSTTIIVQYLDKNKLSLGQYEIEAYVTESALCYFLYLKPNGKLTSIRLLSHELIHIKQYYFNELSVNNSNFAIWKGDTIYKNDKDYKNYPWEKEAFSNQSEIEKQLKTLLIQL